MNLPSSQPFNADDWIALARDDPQEFERRREAAIEDLISRAPIHHQPRLRCLQWRIDMERRRCRTPMAACLRLSTMMWDFIYAEDGFLEALNRLSSVGKGSVSASASPVPRKPGVVLPFRRPSAQ